MDIAYSLVPPLRALCVRLVAGLLVVHACSGQLGHFSRSQVGSDSFDVTSLLSLPLLPVCAIRCSLETENEGSPEQTDKIKMFKNRELERSQKLPLEEGAKLCFEPKSE